MRPTIQRLVRSVAKLAAFATLVTLVSASSVLGTLTTGTLPTAGFTFTSVLSNTVSISGSGVTAEQIATLQKYVKNLSAISNRTASQDAALASYAARLADYQARYAASMDLRASKAANVKTTYSRVPPSATFESGWHSHNGPVIVTVTNGTLTFYDKACGTWDVSAGQTFIESPGQLLNAKTLPAKNAGIENVEWFTTRLFPAGAIDPVPAAVPCTP